MEPQLPHYASPTKSISSSTSSTNSIDDDEMMGYDGDIDNQPMQIQNNTNNNNNNENRGGMKRTRSSLPEGEVKDLVCKLQKLTHDAPQVDFARCVNVKFGTGIVLKAKKLYQEPWGIMVCALEPYEPLEIAIGSKFWAKSDGTVCPYTNLPLLHAMHSVDNSKQYHLC